MEHCMGSGMGHNRLFQAQCCKGKDQKFEKNQRNPVFIKFLMGWDKSLEESKQSDILIKGGPVFLNSCGTGGQFRVRNRNFQKF